METTLKRLRSYVGLVFFLAVVGGCASAPKAPPAGPVAGPPAPSGPAGNEAGPQEAYGPPPPSVFGPEAPRVRPVVLVLGPGLARGFAYVGVLRALTEARIKVAAVLGTEMGGFIGALYGMDANLNRLEWALMRFKSESFVEKRSFLPISDRSKLTAELERAFSRRDLAEAKIPVHLAIHLKGDQNSTIVVARGPVASAVRAAMAVPGVLSDSTWEGVPAIAASDTRPFLISEARALQLGPVVAVNVMDGSGAADGEIQLKDADLVLQPDLAGIGTLDFDKRTEIAFRGKTAVTERIAEIRRLTGMSKNDSKSER